MTLKEEYTQMRKSGKLDIIWFYKFYLEEYSKYPDKVFSLSKNPHGQILYEETGTPGEYIPIVNKNERRQLSIQEFGAGFSMLLSFYANEIIEWCDFKMKVNKIEQNIFTVFKQEKIIEDKLIYID